MPGPRASAETQAALRARLAGAFAGALAFVATGLRAGAFAFAGAFVFVAAAFAMVIPSLIK
jgi:hypothetical protein